MADNKNTLCAGDKIKLDRVLFSNSQTHCGMRRRENGLSMMEN